MLLPYPLLGLLLLPPLADVVLLLSPPVDFVAVCGVVVASVVALRGAAGDGVVPVGAGVVPNADAVLLLLLAGDALLF